MRKRLTYRVLYYVCDEKGSVFPHHSDFYSMWRARLEVWIKRHQKGIHQDIGICVF